MPFCSCGPTGFPAPLGSAVGTHEERSPWCYLAVPGSVSTANGLLELPPYQPGQCSVALKPQGEEGQGTHSPLLAAVLVSFQSLHICASVSWPVAFLKGSSGHLARPPLGMEEAGLFQPHFRSRCPQRWTLPSHSGDQFLEPWQGLQLSSAP